jgi:hypothetical protein
MNNHAEIARTLKRNQLIRSYSSVVRIYPKAKGMTPEQSADQLIRLEDEKKINISFYTDNNYVLCNIDWIA